MNSARRILRASVFTFGVAVFSAGCAMNTMGVYGGGTVGTGLGYSDASINSQQHGAITGVSYFDAHGKVLSTSGSPLTDVRVEVKTERSDTDTQTDLNGKFTVPLIVGQNEKITFRFIWKHKTMSYEIENIPGDIRSAELEFRISAEGKISAPQVDFY